MAMWLPECSEKHVAQLAAARIGMVVAEVDPKLASAGAVEKILEESGAAVSFAGATAVQAFVRGLVDAAVFVVLSASKPRVWGKIWRMYAAL